MLATLTHDQFSDENWIFERKLDGERCLVFRKGKSVALKSRHRKTINEQYPELVEAIRSQSSVDFVADGEIVAFEKGVTSFSRLQERMHLQDPEEIRSSRVAVYFYLFDVLNVEGYDVTGIELRYRKSILKNMLNFKDPLRFTVHRNREGERYFEEACRKKWEGLIAKEASSPYIHKRSKHWLKFKCTHQQEFVIGGYTDPEGERIGFGALLIGYYDEGTLRYAGKVGTGYDDQMLRRLSKRFAQGKRRSPAFDAGNLPHKNVHWLTPKLVAEVGFTEWTGDSKLRHPRFLGLRRDKKAKDVVRES